MLNIYSYFDISINMCKIVISHYTLANKAVSIQCAKGIVHFEIIFWYVLAYTLRRNGSI